MYSHQADHNLKLWLCDVQVKIAKKIIWEHNLQGKCEESATVYPYMKHTWQSCGSTTVANSRVRVYTSAGTCPQRKWATVVDSCRLSFSKFNNVELLMQSLALSIQSAGRNSIFKVTVHADLKNTCHKISKITNLCMPSPHWFQEPQKEGKFMDKHRRKGWKGW